jgi:hypothetical protein
MADNAKKLMNSIKPNDNSMPEGYATPKGAIGYDNVRDVLPHQNIIASSVQLADNNDGAIPMCLPIIFGTAAVGTLTAANYPRGCVYIQYTA